MSKKANIPSSSPPSFPPNVASATIPPPVDSAGYSHLRWAALVVLVFAINFFFPKNYYSASVGALSYLPFTWQAGWLIVGLLAIAHAPALEKGRRWMLAGTAIVFALSLVCFRSDYPSVHGDGENGGKPWHAQFCAIRHYPAYSDARLGPMLNRVFSKVNPIDLHPRAPRVLRDTRLDSSDLLLSTLWGLIFALLVFRATRTAGLPLALLLLTYPATLNFYGHFDDYSLPVLLAMAWLLAVLAPRWRWKRVAVLLPLLALAAYAHPLLLILAPLTLAYAVIERLEAKGWTWYRRFIVSGALAVGFLAMFNSRGIVEHGLQFCKPGGDLMPHFLAERANLLLLTSLPALLLVTVGMGNRIADNARYHAGLLTLILSTTLFFSLYLSLGIYDELLMSVVAVILLAGALMIHLSRETSSRHVLAYVAVFSMLLFIPRVGVNSTRRVVDWFLQNGEAEPYTPLHMGSTPYIHLALRVPVTSNEDIRLRADILRRGVLTQHPFWKARQGWNIPHYLVGAVEAYGMTEENRKLLGQIIDNDPNAALALCDPKTFEREHYRGRSAELIRDASLQLIQDRIRAGTAKDSHLRIHEQLRRPSGEQTPYPAGKVR